MVNSNPRCIVCEKKTKIKKIDSDIDGLYTCQECNNTFLYPQQKNISKYYPKIYWQHPGKLSYIRSGLHHIFQIRRASWIKRYLKNGKILDVGAGEGIFGEYMGSNYIVSSQEASFAKVLNKKVIKKDFLKWENKDKYDAIVFLESLEHVPYPSQYIRKCYRLLNKNGLIFIECPRFDCLESKLLGKYWLHRDLPRHFTHFTKRGLGYIMDTNGFEIITFKGILSYEYSPYILLASIFKMLKIKPIDFRNINFSNILKILIILLVFPITALLETVLFLINESPMFLVVAKKK